MSATHTETKVAIITGGARGLGFSCAQRLARQGCCCVLFDLHESEAHTAAEILGANHLGLSVDVTDENAVASALASVTRRVGTPAILINSAGIIGPNMPACKAPVAEVEKVMRVNFFGTFIMCAQVAPLMLPNKWGRIVNVASIAGKEGNPNLSAYSASKGAVIAFTKSLGKELAQTGILVNAIAPAVIATEMNRDVTPETLTMMLSKIPMGRLGKPEEVANLVAFLASEENSFSTGAVFDLSGGRATY